MKIIQLPGGFLNTAQLIAGFNMNLIALTVWRQAGFAKGSSGFLAG